MISIDSRSEDEAEAITEIGCSQASSSSEINNSQNISRLLHVGETSASKQLQRSVTMIGETSRRSTNEQTIGDPLDLSLSAISIEERSRVEWVDR